MASLKKNLQIIHDGLVKNIAIVKTQAKEKARVAAYEYMQHRDNKDLSDMKHDQFERINAVVAWLEKMDSVVNEIPEIHEDEESVAFANETA